MLWICFFNEINCTEPKRHVTKFMKEFNVLTFLCVRRQQGDLPGSFLVLKEALVMKVLESGVLVVVEGVSATLIPIGPSLGWPVKHHQTLYHHHHPLLVQCKNKSKTFPNVFHLSGARCTLLLQ